MVDGLKAILDVSLDDEALFDQEQFEPEASFKAFALARDFSLDSAAVEQLVDLVFRGNSCMIKGYDATVVRKLVKAWLVDLNTRGIEQATIVYLQAELINVAAEARERDLRRGLRRSGLRVDTVLMRKSPTHCDLGGVFKRKPDVDKLMRRASDISRIYNSIRRLAAASGVKIRQIDRSDPERSRPHRFSHLVPLVGNNHLEEDHPDPSFNRLRRIFSGDLDHFDDLSVAAHAVPGLMVPKSVKYSQQKNAPTFPIVAKNLVESCGLAKYLIETPLQWATFVRWVDDHSLELEVENFWIFQEFIESPVERPASLRVFVDCLGNVMASQLLYGPRFSDGLKVRNSDRPDGSKSNIEAMLEDPDSPYFLDARLITSNKSFAVQELDVPMTQMLVDPKSSLRGENPIKFYRDPNTGRRILTHEKLNMPTVQETVFTRLTGWITIGFDRGDFVPNDTERELLEAHGFDPEDPRLPKELVDQIRLIARELSIKDGDVYALYLGLDFVRGKDGNWYFLEANRRPSLTAVREAELLSDRDNVLEFVVGRIMERIASLNS